MGIRDRGFHPLRVARVVAETPEASTFVLDVPDSFAYEAGQFCTFKVPAGGEELQRCYSMSSMPGEPFAVTVKRVPCGAASNWLLDHVAEGTVLEASAPTGLFRLPPGDADVVAFAAGSGITPVWSVVKAALTNFRREHRPTEVVQPPVPDASSRDGDLRTEARWLLLVADAYAQSEIARVGDSGLPESVGA